jgi:hypothetical protein
MLINAIQNLNWTLYTKHGILLPEGDDAFSSLLSMPSGGAPPGLSVSS